MFKPLAPTSVGWQAAATRGLWAYYWQVEKPLYGMARAGYNPGMRHALLLLLVLACSIGAAGGAVACPGCRDALAAQGNANRSPWDGIQGEGGAAFSYSVLFMLGIFVAMLTGFGGAFWWFSRHTPASTPSQAPAADSAPAAEPGRP
jgi:hypothetical protein